MGICRADERRLSHSADLPAAQRRARRMALATRVIKPETSDKMRYLMRLNAEKGTARQGRRAGLLRRRQDRHLGEGRRRALFQDQGARLDFTAVLPADEPRYLMLIMLDEPQATAGNPRLRHLGLERGADRRRRSSPGSRRCSASSRASTCRRPTSLILASVDGDAGKRRRRPGRFRPGDFRPRSDEARANSMKLENLLTVDSVSDARFGDARASTASAPTAAP